MKFSWIPTGVKCDEILHFIIVIWPNLCNNTVWHWRPMFVSYFWTATRIRKSVFCPNSTIKNMNYPAPVIRIIGKNFSDKIYFTNYHSMIGPPCSNLFTTCIIDQVLCFIFQQKLCNITMKIKIMYSSSSMPVYQWLFIPSLLCGGKNSEKTSVYALATIK